MDWDLRISKSGNKITHSCSTSLKRVVDEVIIYLDITTEDEIDPIVQEVFDYWKGKMGRSRTHLRLGDKRYNKILTRLKDVRGDKSVLIRAIDGCAQSAWHMGNNPSSKRYNDIELIFRNIAKMEHFAAASNKKVIEDVLLNWEYEPNKFD